MTGAERDGAVAALARDAATLLGLALADPDAPVPSCPGWSLRDLLVHTGEVHRNKLALLERGRLEPPQGTLVVEAAPAAEAGLDALGGWFLRGADALGRFLAVADPGTPVWSWGPDRTVGFWVRRMAQETGVHRWDAQQAAGIDGGFDPGFAIDGVDEFVDVWLPDPRQPRWAADPATVHLHATDAPGEWTVRLEPGGVSASRGHAKGDAALRGRAEDLLLVLWRRRPPDRLEVLGAADVAHRFLAHARL